MQTVWFQLLLGAITLYLGTELLVRSSVNIARKYHISPIIIGMTLMAFGTSVPDAFLSTINQIQGMSGDVALGNAIGSNIANIGLALGVFLLIRPFSLSRQVKSTKIPLLLLVYLLMFCVMLGGKVSRAEGVFLIMVLLLYIAYQYFFSSEEGGERKKKAPVKKGSLFVQSLIALSGVLLLVFGTKLLLDFLIDLGERNLLSERFPGITLVAFATSLPELAAAFVIAFRGRPEMMLGTIIGSNILNPLIIFPSAALVRPIKFSHNMLLIDFPVMVGFTILLWILMLLGNNRLRRVDGAILLVAYGSYIAFLYA